MERPITITVTVNNPWDALLVLILEQIINESNGEEALFLDDELGFFTDRIAEVAIRHNTARNRESGAFCDIVKGEIERINRLKEWIEHS